MQRNTNFSVSVLSIVLTICLIGRTKSYSINSNETEITNNQTVRASPKLSVRGNSVSISCFASDSVVSLTDGLTKPIAQLHTSDQIYTAQHFNLTTTHMILMLHQDRRQLTLFHTLITASGHQLSVTPLHLIPIVDHDNNLIFVAARDVHIGDVLRVMSDKGEMMNSMVIEVKMEMKQGFSAPLTDAGTLMVNGVLSSCYANVHSHALAHWSMGVVRFYDAVVRSVWKNEGLGAEDGLHVVPRMMYAMASTIVPSLLRTT